MIYLLLILFLFFSGCVNLTNPKKNKYVNNVQKKFKKTFNFKVTNLHCKLCAYNLVKFISKIDGVLNVKFNYVSKNYQQSYFTVEIDSRKIGQEHVTVPLIKSGFTLNTNLNK